ncbi:PREDICTED: serine protease gd-like isoform X2 [Vollenhovia emeryi]|uniref:serine protease gd-like isoform X2 n=1 Tax=Vollenhovia emeryi TaxID=411798 RepID=UPI0005F523FA|nr:PREDICTED: serine protease gd-like isoform X2 [Vollenhovia emeryi]
MSHVFKEIEGRTAVSSTFRDTQKSSANVRPTMELGHIVYPPNEESISQNLQPWHRNSSSYYVYNPTYINNDGCGVTSYYNDNINSLIPNGESILPGQWPWVVALYTKNETKLKHYFLCTGSILTNRHILTGKFGYSEWRDVLIVFGLSAERKLNMKETITRKMSSYTVHPSWHEYTADSDLAIITLTKSVEYSPFIKPICIWSGPPDLEDLADRTGYVVGWGEFEFNVSKLGVPRMIRVPIINKEDCIASDSRFSYFISNRTFCAGLRDGLFVNGYCDADIGSGMVFFNAVTGRYELRGVTSKSIHRAGICFSKQYVIFVDVAKYVSWIRDQVFNS